MLQDTPTIRYYQRITDAVSDLWTRGYRLDDVRLYVDGYLASLRHSCALEPFQIHRLEEEVNRYIYDPSNFAVPQPEPESELGYY